MDIEESLLLGLQNENSSTKLVTVMDSNRTFIHSNSVKLTPKKSINIHPEKVD